MTRAETESERDGRTDRQRDTGRERQRGVSGGQAINPMKKTTAKGKRDCDVATNNEKTTEIGDTRLTL